MQKHVRILALLGLSLIQNVHAEPYIGAAIGGNVIIIDKKIRFGSTVTYPVDRYTGVRGQLLAGYNIHWNGFIPYYQNATPDEYGVIPDEMFFALEADADFNSSDAMRTRKPWMFGVNAATKEQQNWAFDLLALAKRRYGKSLVFFAGPGVTQGHFSVFTPAPTAGNLGVTGSPSVWKTGWTIKAGVEIPMTDAVSMVVAYQYSNYDSITWTRTEPLTKTSVTTHYSPTVNSLTVGINW